MDKSSASAYVYAKASGMLAKSFVGPRIIQLFDAHNLSDLWSMIFHTEVPLVPENMLAKLIEEKAEEVFILDFIKLLDAYDKPDVVAVQLLRLYDYSNIKELGAALLKGQLNMPMIANIGKYSMLKYAMWPKIQSITKDSTINWYNTVPAREEQKDVDARLDIQYSKELWVAVKKIPGSEREAVKKLIKTYIVFQNIIWAIRLMSYYGMKHDDIIQQLVFENDNVAGDDVLAGPALHILDKPLDSWDDWSSWQYVDFLNPNEDGGIWQIDPRWIQNAVNLHLNKMAYREFGQHFSSSHVLVAWYKIKEYELNCIRTAVEGLRLNVEASHLKHFTGAQG